MDYQKYAQTQGSIMLRFLNASNKNSLNKIEKILNLRKKKQNYQSKNVEKIILNVKKMEIKH